MYGRPQIQGFYAGVSPRMSPCVQLGDCCGKNCLREFYLLGSLNLYSRPNPAET